MTASTDVPMLLIEFNTDVFRDALAKAPEAAARAERSLGVFGSLEHLDRRPHRYPVPYRRQGQRLGRNAPCPCGSGRKHKACCRQR